MLEIEHSKEILPHNIYGLIVKVPNVISFPASPYAEQVIDAQPHTFDHTRRVILHKGKMYPISQKDSIRFKMHGDVFLAEHEVYINAAVGSRLIMLHPEKRELSISTCTLRPPGMTWWDPSTLQYPAQIEDGIPSEILTYQDHHFYVMPYADPSHVDTLINICSKQSLKRMWQIQENAISPD